MRISTAMEILGRVKEALVPAAQGPTGNNAGTQLTLPLAARASLLLDLCDLEEVPAAYAPTVAAMWSLVEQLESSTNGAHAAKQLSETLEIACPHCPRPPKRASVAPVPSPEMTLSERDMASSRGFALYSWHSAEQHG